MLPIRKWLKQYRGVLVLALGLISLSTVLVVAQQQQPTQPEQAIVAVPTMTSPPSPTATPTPTVAASIPATPAKPAQAQKTQQPPAKKSVGGKPELTPEEQELNRRAKEAFAARSGTVDSVIEMHVAIVEGVSALNLAANSEAALFDQQGKSLGQLEANTPYTAQTDGASIQFGNSQLPAIVQVDPGPTGLLQVNDRTYRGRLLLVVNKGGIWAVNYVNLRKYLHSVVASEVSPSWHQNALKAQAIAARSYALTYYFKPVSSFYHLGDDEYFQVYSGIDKEAPETNQAVDATAGEFVSYRGGIVESLYAASDDIVAEAFQGRGMSQLGAYDLAQQGYGYEQILSHYYPGTGVGRIALDQE